MTNMTVLQEALAVFVLLLQLTQGAKGDTDVPSSIATLRNPQLDIPLQDLLLAPLEGDESVDLDERLQRAFVQCRELGVTSFMYDSNADATGGHLPSIDAVDVAYCNRVRYVRHQRLHFREVHKELQQSDTSPYSRQVDTREIDEVSFHEFFELYAEKAQPVLLQHPENAVGQMLGLGNSESDGEKEVATGKSTMDKFLANCFGEQKQRGRNDNQIETRPLLIENKECAAILETTFRVPIFVTHDYIQRTNASRDEAFLPSIVELPPVSSSEIELDAPNSAKDIVACPYGLHMLAIPLGDVDTRASLFGHKFAPITPPAILRNQFREIALDSDATVATRTTLLDTVYFQRVQELYSRVKLKPGHNMLFVPGSVVSTMRSVATTSSKTRRAQMLRFCYCDASNVKDVKQFIALDALLMTGDNRDEAVLALLQTVQSPGFDSSFSRRPTLSDTNWKTFVKWPRDPAYLAKKNRRQRSFDNEESDEEQLSRRERLKQWQEDKRWERYIASLTLPVAWPPLVVNTTRTTATIRWQELYQPLKHDVTSYGYEVSWKHERHDGSAIELNGNLESAVNVTHDELKRSKMPSTLFGDDFDGRDLEAVITGLEAGTAYSFSVRLLVGETRGAVSGASRRVVTSPCSHPSRIPGVPEVGDMEKICLTLRWLDADDDGGKEIQWYLVSTEKLPEKGEQENLKTGRGADDGAFVCEHEKVIAVNASVGHGQVTSESLSSGALWLSTKVCGLFPGAAYTFRVAAMNTLGAGFWSHRSSRIEMSPSHPTELNGRQEAFAIPLLKGVGNHGYSVVSGFDILSQSDLSALIIQDPHRILRSSGAQLEDVALPHVLLSDTKEQVQILTNSKSEVEVEVVRTFEAWTGHYSPRLFDVSAELVLADPPDASQPLRNAHEVRDRVMLAIRGGVPFVFKLHHAQRAGALGLIIADAKGVCSGGFDQSCVPGSDKRHGEGFSAQERHILWQRTHIPCVLVLKEAAQELLKLLGGGAQDKMAT